MGLLDAVVATGFRSGGVVLGVTLGVPVVPGGRWLDIFIFFLYTEGFCLEALLTQDCEHLGFSWESQKGLQ